MNKPVIQLSLAISGREEEARKEAEKATKKLRDCGFPVFSPFELCADIEKARQLAPEHWTDAKQWWACMKVCCDNIASGGVDVVVEPYASDVYSYGQHIEFMLADKFSIDTICHDKTGKRHFAYSQLNEATLLEIAAILEYGVRR